MALTGRQCRIIRRLAEQRAYQLHAAQGIRSQLPPVPDVDGPAVPGSEHWTDTDLHEASQLYQTTIRAVIDCNGWPY